jgi:hypothetical protein
MGAWWPHDTPKCLQEGLYFDHNSMATIAAMACQQRTVCLYGSMYMLSHGFWWFADGIAQSQALNSGYNQAGTLLLNLSQSTRILQMV